MKIDTNLVKHVAGLARIEIPEKDLDRIKTNLMNIIDHIKELGEVDTNGVSPMYTPISEWISFYKEEYQLRIDVIKDSLEADDVLLNAPDKRDNQFVVRAVIEEN